jgi:GAF domain-containing protein
VSERFEAAIRAIEDTLLAEGAPAAKLRAVAEAIRGADARYSWAGFYLLRGDTLELGPYAGPATEHARIPIGRGVCGTAVETGRNQIIGDVRECANYLSCSATVRSEIVVLIRHDGEVLGLIDIDSDEVGAFGPDDERDLERIAEQIAPVVSEVL